MCVSPVGNTNWLLQRAMTTTLLASDIIILMNNTLRYVFGMYRSKLYQCRIMEHFKTSSFIMLVI